ncbi:SGNH/GDSL hydrolase family protein [Nocardia cyriacigeorgica]|uniref:SGNH/GDSL hydrolase family protein n=1 Tax=Nocardia cyriacigeorgica TaxID=135487 RepID=A0A6P1CHX8_9NOCA|nr:SGNH/GDSL hydrolase family protein [Nocardia cyriacigeorgica]NEW31998.1 SGNH/GDSL hydrolase family protein [Nocardia cyriacigeorgica]
MIGWTRRRTTARTSTTGRRRGTVVAALLATAALVLAGCSDDADAGTTTAWSDSWVTAQQAAVDLWEPNWSTGGFENQTIRQVIRPTLGGDEVRIKFSNLFGERPLRIAAATIAEPADGAAVRAESVRPLLFGGAESTEIPAGAETTSDAVDFPVTALRPVTVTIYLAEPTGPATFHQTGNATSYLASGDHVADPAAAPFTDTSRSWYYLADLEVNGTGAEGAVVTFGDSITDGAEATADADNRYPDVLATRLAADGSARAVLNTGISGNRVLTDSDYTGQSAKTRFQRDVLDRDGASTVILLEGINDIGASELDEPWVHPNPEVSADQLIAGYRELIALARADGLRVVGATLTPYKGAPYYSERGEAVRDAVNTWIRSSGEFDAVIDFERAVADPADPDAIAPAFDSGDHLHPSPAGYATMAQAIDLAQL